MLLFLLRTCVTCVMGAVAKLLLLPAFFFSNIFFPRSECQIVWTLIRTYNLSVLICVQTVCKGYPQTTVAASKLKSYGDLLYIVIHVPWINSLHDGKFFMLLLFQNQLVQSIFRHTIFWQSAIQFGSRCIGPALCWACICVQTVCNVYQKTTIAGKE